MKREREPRDRSLVILIEIDPGGDPISGLLHDRHGETQGFHGWMQFMAAVESARTAETEVRPK